MNNILDIFLMASIADIISFIQKETPYQVVDVKTENKWVAVDISYNNKSVRLKFRLL